MSEASEIRADFDPHREAERIRDAIRAGLEEYGSAGLAFSGGIESTLLMDLTADMNGVHAFTVRTGLEFPFMLDHVDRAMQGRPHTVVTSDPLASWATDGIPSVVVPIEHSDDARRMHGAAKGPLITAWWACCGNHISAPVWSAMIAADFRFALAGQRARDYPGPRAAPTVPLGSVIEVQHPLWRYTRAEVESICAARGTILPPQYSDPEAPHNGLDCAICPAMLSRKRALWMERSGFSDQLEAAALAHQKILEAIDGAFASNWLAHEA